MKLLPFSLAQFKSGAVAVTRDGRKVQYVGMMPEGHDWKFPVVGCFTDEEGPLCWTKEGYWAKGTGHDRDLFMMPEKVDRWVNVYPESTWSHFDSKEDAERFATDERIACIKVSYYGGEGLEPEPQSKEG